MKDTASLIEEWESDIILLEASLRQDSPPATSPLTPGERQALMQQLRQARAAQAMLYGLLALLK